ncbi:MAG: hypothetical protein M1814_002368 [Vezdaea aestivalis]|nr:MAG: hypothetical protein M1814_002368 [Vezdaea aestivalis]
MRLEDRTRHPSKIPSYPKATNQSHASKLLRTQKSLRFDIDRRTLLNITNTPDQPLTPIPTFRYPTMAKTRTKPTKNKRQRRRKPSPAAAPNPSSDDPALLLSEALDQLQTSPPLALPLATQVLRLLNPSSTLPHPLKALPALTLLAQIHLALDEPEAAYEQYRAAAEAVESADRELVDVADAAEVYLWLSQLEPEGGERSVAWIEKGAEGLRRGIVDLDGDEDKVGRLKGMLADALCGEVEVWMTDLSLDPLAEQRSEALTTEALLLAPTDPAPLQTLASVRISQSRLPDAQSALDRSLTLWEDLPPSDPRIPEFAARVSLVRLLLETGMREEALRVCERLVLEDEESVEVWYLGGWGLWMAAIRDGERGGRDGRKLRKAREWLGVALGLYQRGGNEDERLRDHAVELVGLIDDLLGDEEDGEEWNDDDDDDDDDDDVESVEMENAS